MKLTIDFDKKEIKVLEKVKLNELVDILKKMFPDNKWKEFIIDTNTTIVWRSHPVYYPYHWYNGIYYGTTLTASGSASGISSSISGCSTNNVVYGTSTSLNIGSCTTGTYNFDVTTN